MRLTQYFTFGFISGVLILFACACKEQVKDDNSKMREGLYRAVCQLTRRYTDSLNNATDTLAAQTIMSHYESKMQNLYMRYPPASDRLLTEDYNDTIFALTQKLHEAYKHALSPMDSISRDSTLNDSVLWRIPFVLNNVKSGKNEMKKGAKKSK